MSEQPGNGSDYDEILHGRSPDVADVAPAAPHGFDEEAPQVAHPEYHYPPGYGPDGSIDVQQPEWGSADQLPADDMRDG
jgi:hypothetical protein